MDSLLKTDVPHRHIVPHSRAGAEYPIMAHMRIAVSSELVRLVTEFRVG